MGVKYEPYLVTLIIPNKFSDNLKEHMNIEKLNSLARTDFTNFIQSENNVKYKIVIPFLQSFNHQDLDLEHAAQGSRIDINIGNRIIVETKALNINLNNHIQQLSDYSSKELPVLAILTNGKHFRIYPPQWRYWRTFPEKLIYEFELNDLGNLQLINRLEKILGFSNYENEEFIVHIEQREREIIETKREIEKIKKLKIEQVSELNGEINDLKEQMLEINEQIKMKEAIIAGVNANVIPEVEDKIKEHLLPIKKTQAPEVSYTTNQKALNPFLDEQSEIEMVKKRIPKWFSSPGQANHKILVTYFKLKGNHNSVQLAELQKACAGIAYFSTHYHKMKVIGKKNHGKIFEEKNQQIFLWEPVKIFIETEYEKFQKP